jgi:hypothetical protein
MNLRASRGLTTAAVAATAVLALSLPSGAAEVNPSAYVAKISQELPGAPATTVGPLAYADKSKPDASVAKVNVANIASAGASFSKVAIDTATGAQTVTATLADIRAGMGRPAATGLAATTLKTTCTTAPGGTPAGKVEILGGRLGDTKLVAAPAPNTTVDIPGPVPGGPALGKLVLNEQVKNADGSLTLYAAHLNVERGPLGSTEAVLGAATCGNATAPAARA